MKLDEIVTWYQKKIGTYDKQQWEKTVEQKILDGFRSVTLKTAKLKPELIDVDLVRGSTFPKAKSKQSLLTVIRLAIQRYLLLPLYSQWWVAQTSANCFAILLALYVMQMVNWALYTFNIHKVENATTISNGNATVCAKNSLEDVEYVISASELLIPMGLSLLLSLIHSQIVATNTVSSVKSKRRRFSNPNRSGKRQEPKMRRKRLVKIRSQDGAEVATQARKPSVIKIFNSTAEVITKTLLNAPALKLENTQKIDVSSSSSVPSNAVNEDFSITSVIPKTTPYNINGLQLDLIPVTDTMKTYGNNNISFALDNNLTQRKRNVNWHSPIHNYATETSEKQQQTSPQLCISTTSSDSSPTISVARICAVGKDNPRRCQGDTSVNDKSSESMRIDDSVQEFYNDLIRRTDASECSNEPSIICEANQVQIESLVVGLVDEALDNMECIARRRHIGEDDGFESLNGKSSSGEETNSPLPATSEAAKSQLRLRLNASDRAIQSNEPESQAASHYIRKLSTAFECESVKNQPQPLCCDAFQQTKNPLPRLASGSTDESEEELDDAEAISSPASGGKNYNDTTSATEWLGVTTNSEECSYSSEIDNSDQYKNHPSDDDVDLDFTPAILNPHGISDRISCTIWERREIKKAQMSVLEISSCIIERVESMPETNDYIYFGISFTILLSLIPSFCRLCEATMDLDKTSEVNYFDVPMLLWEKSTFSIATIFRLAFGSTRWERVVVIIALIQRFCLTSVLFIIFAVAERTFKQRFLYAKLFSHLTSSRRARKSNLPHFRLNKVRNIKIWLSVRSYLKKRGPQRSVEVIVSAAFLVTLLLLAFLSVEWLKDSVRLHSHLNLEALIWSTTVGIFLLRFMMLGNKIHDKYRSVSVLITEQINLYLQIEQKPKKKEELMVANSVLKLASDLLKELETPFKISGLSANPLLFTTIKVVILSALSGVLSEMLGFKLKLHKIKIK